MTPPFFSDSPRHSRGRFEKNTELATLEASYENCRRLNKRYGTTYYWSTYLLPRIKRHHVHALYGFCRYADRKLYFTPT